jgi:hypothetical protein
VGSADGSGDGASVELADGVGAAGGADVAAGVGVGAAAGAGMTVGAGVTVGPIAGAATPGAPSDVGGGLDEASGAG